MKKVIYLLYIFFTMLGCKSPKEAQTETKINGKQNNILTEESGSLENELLTKGIDFSASGNEPFWSLTIGVDNIIHFKTVSGIDLKVATPEVLYAIDKNVTNYVIDEGDYNINMQLTAQECINNMSGNKSDYSVVVNVIKKTDKIFTAYKGCGHYLKDYRLNDIWVLKNINTQPLNKTGFTKGLPLLEINFAQKKIFGHAGCNEISGFMEVQGNKIKFGKIIITSNFCPNKNFEENYLANLSGKTIPYKLPGNGKLQLQINKDSIYYYTKID